MWLRNIKINNKPKIVSDIDIAIYSEDINSTIMNLIRNDLEDLNIIYKIDLVNFNAITKESLRNSIIRDGVEIYGRKK